MPALYQKYDNWDKGVINAIAGTKLPINAALRSQNCIHREGRWKKLPGLVEKNKTQIGNDGVWSITKFYQPIDNKVTTICASGANIYKFDEQQETFISIQESLFPNQPIEFIDYNGKLYFGSSKNTWRRYDGGSQTYEVGSTAPPRKFHKIIFNEFAGRFFGIFEDSLYWSDHIDDAGIESWPDGNIQLFTPIKGGLPVTHEIFEGRVTVFSKHAINSGTVVGPPETWSFEREKAQAGIIAPRTLKRYGTNFFMLTPGFEVYVWPADKFITKGRVKFEINEDFASLASAEIVEDRYYYLSFRSTDVKGTSYDSFGVPQATPLEEQYHLWVYDILTDRWFGPHVQYSIVSMYWDADTNLLLCGGTDELAGFVMEHRGKDIKNKASKCKFLSSFSDYEKPRIDKRFSKIWLEAKHEGTKPGGEGQIELRVYTDGGYGFPQNQLISLVDTSTPDNIIRDTASSTRESIVKRGYIPELYGRGTNVLIEMLHEYLKGDFEFSEFELEYFLKYNKENRGT